MKKVIVAILCASFALSCCALRKELVIPRTELQEKVSKKFPYARDIGIARLTVQSPEVYFKGKNIGLKAVYSGNLLNADVRGTVDIYGRVVYASETGAFYLRDLVVADVTINEKSLLQNTTMQKTVDKIVSNYLEGFCIYRLNPDKSKENLARLLVKDIFVRDDDLVILLGK
mgnify:CR=1 FL=1